ncbi:DUF4421 family protein [uncultured Lacinutrix sp.]|uniref:DUF4421 family protein n=1 Tax=uncultured Lacinutrix sp. TaxID=574032 RepID=UPI00261BE950|nr:DUF4421 family protein [uncultured Lacinutrix sp.]
MNISNAISQNKTSEDFTSILSFTDKLIIKANIDTQTDSYFVQSENDSDFNLSTNNQFRLGISLDYKFIGFGIGFSPKFFPGNNDNNIKGESSFQDYTFRFFLGKWTQEIQYKKVQSFYVENTNDFIPNWIDGQDAYIQFPDFKTIFWRGSTSFVLNPNFSLRNVVYNTEWQRKSAGSFIPTLRYGYTRFSGIIEDSKSYENSFNISVAPEYYYTLVIHENWFVSFFASPSFGIRFSNDGEDGTDIKERNVYWPAAFDGGLQLGYSSNKFIYGANLKFQNTWYNEDSMTNITNDSVFAKIYFGYRFNAPKIVEKPFNWIEKKFGL